MDGGQSPWAPGCGPWDVGPAASCARQAARQRSWVVVWPLRPRHLFPSSPVWGEKNNFLTFDGLMRSSGPFGHIQGIHTNWRSFFFWREE